MDDRRGVVTGVLPGEGMAGAFSQIAFLISRPHTFMDGLVDVAAYNVDILSQIYKDNGQACVLTHGKFAIFGDIRVLKQLVQDILSGWGSLHIQAFPQGLSDIRAQLIRRIKGQLLDRKSYLFTAYFTHLLILFQPVNNLFIAIHVKEAAKISS